MARLLGKNVPSQQRIAHEISPSFAYCIRYDFILKYLEFLGFPEMILNFLRNRFSNTTGELKDYEPTEKLFQILKGISQG